MFISVKLASGERREAVYSPPVPRCQRYPVHEMYERLSSLLIMESHLRCEERREVQAEIRPPGQKTDCNWQTVDTINHS